MNSIKLNLPYPPSELLPNKKSSWQKKMSISRDYKNQCLLMLMEQIPQYRDKYLLKSVNMIITFYPMDGHLADYDGLYRAFKPGQDALVHLGIIKDDSPKVIKRVVLKMGKVDKKNPRTEIEIEQILR